MAERADPQQEVQKMEDMVDPMTGSSVDVSLKADSSDASCSGISDILCS